jgi:N-acyl-L-homoserine lactone synthetase
MDFGNFWSRGRHLPKSSNFNRPGGMTMELQESLSRADELARGMVATAPLSFRLAQTPAELTAVYRLRYEVIVERGWARPEDLPDGLERDEYDDHAVHIAAWDGAQMAATSRIVLPAPDRVLPTERAFRIKIEPYGQVVDMGRQIVAHAYSNVEHLVFAALLAQTWLEIHRRGYTLVCGDFTQAVTRLYRLMGFQVTQVGPAREFWGQERFPIVVDVASSVPALLKRWGRFAQMSIPA